MSLTVLLELQKSVAALRTDIAGSRSDIAALRTEIRGLSSDMTALRSSVYGARLDISSLRSDVSEIRGDIHSLRQNMQELYGESRQQVADLAEYLAGALASVESKLQSIISAPPCEELIQVRCMLRRIKFLLSRPGQVSLVSVGEVSMAKVKGIQFAAVLPAPPADEAEWNEIQKGVLELVIGDKAITVETTKDQQLTAERQVTGDEFVVLQDTTVVGTFAYIDDSGNVSQKTEFVVEVKDTVPPVAPGEVGLVALGEVDVEIPDEEPPVDEPPVDEPPVDEPPVDEPPAE
jgi:hypothetical protein